MRGETVPTRRRRSGLVLGVGAAALLAIGTLATHAPPDGTDQADAADGYVASVSQPDLEALLSPAVPRISTAALAAADDKPKAKNKPEVDKAKERKRPVVPPDAEYLAVTLGAEGIPRVMLDAYKRAEATATPGCNLTWHMLAALGRVESGHGAAGKAVTSDGTLVYPILGPRLDGGQFAAISDTDGGVLDGDPVWDRAVGPMQFIPSTWALLAQDGNGDGKRNPHNVYDATAAAAHYLCLYDRDLSQTGQLRDAYFSYNRSQSYVDAVYSFYRGYLLADGLVVAQPSLPEVDESPREPAPPEPEPKDPEPKDPAPKDPGPKEQGEPETEASEDSEPQDKPAAEEPAKQPTKAKEPAPEAGPAVTEEPEQIPQTDEEVTAEEAAPDSAPATPKPAAQSGDDE